ncbi:hypothetical protein [Nitrosomonas sp. Nm166]|uniref:hypothetical protein n=1 Tax=Nitrosomonas sp. Nm166 TaxID=1881054 RepID=UPI0008E447CC|nr:hypothetical protein [Nitrosomonas sp. Nm166]SFF03295.1 hypothetical protein SAMN05428977_10444 [Nitrosomonas sp. Nm166]
MKNKKQPLAVQLVEARGMLTSPKTPYTFDLILKLGRNLRQRHQLITGPIAI